MRKSFIISTVACLFLAACGSNSGTINSADQSGDSLGENYGQSGEEDVEFGNPDFWANPNEWLSSQPTCYTDEECYGSGSESENNGFSKTLIETVPIFNGDIYNAYDYGNGQVWLELDLMNYDSALKVNCAIAQNSCPAGYRLPTKSELSYIANYLDNIENFGYLFSVSYAYEIVSSPWETSIYAHMWTSDCNYLITWRKSVHGEFYSYERRFSDEPDNNPEVMGTVRCIKE